MTSQKSKILLTASICFLAGFGAACGTSLGVKVYRLRNDHGGIRRVYQGKAYVVKFQDAEGFYCTSPTDFETITESLKQCRELCGR